MTEHDNSKYLKSKLFKYFVMAKDRNTCISYHTVFVSVALPLGNDK